MEEEKKQIYLDPIKNKECLIITLIYKDKYSDNDLISIARLFNVLGLNYDIAAIAPENFDLSYYKSNFPFTYYVQIPEAFFQNFPNGYNSLFTDKNFYSIFKNYKYILIYHTDCWVFRNELDYWCNLDYDYIGAPFIYYFFHNYSNFEKFNPFNRVGNGGFSLRKVQWCMNVLENNSLNTFDTSKLMPGELLNEDTFFANQPGNIPTIYEAQKFAWSDHPIIFFQMNNGKAPFGAHRIFDYLQIYITLNLIH